MPRSLLLLALLFAACDAPLVSECVPGIDPDCEDDPTGPNEIVAGVDVTALFAPPTTSEVAEAQVRLGASATPSFAHLVPLADAADGARQFRLSLGSGNDVIASALVRIPGAPAATAPLPVVVVLPDGTDGASETDLLTGVGFGAIETGYVQVVLAYRGEALHVGGETIASDLAPDPYHADVRDLLALLAALPGTPRADPGRVALVGIGRGGTVALLAAGQSTSAAVVVTLGAPTDLFAASFRAEARAVLLGQTPPAPYPALDVLAAPVVALRDAEIDRAEARLRLLALSPARLRLNLPAVLGLHAVGDAVVGDDQLVSLRAALTGAPSTPRTTTPIEGPTHAGLVDDAGARSALVQFLSVVL